MINRLIIKIVHWISVTLLLLVVLANTACHSVASTHTPVGASMESIYHRAINGESEQRVAAFRSTHQHVAITTDHHDSAAIQRVANPDITLYIYPHFAGKSPDRIAIPGYYSYFPLYEHVHYQTNHS